ncbi:type II toxin-antitoxin system RelE/ParE family toxin [Candidatus Woesearchaeota archaeon]|nr:type II toxin-antitoxin system RelE/ParE family toxin [Candidatus Woesearchaeota archaeon]
MWFNIHSQEFSSRFLKHLKKYPGLKEHVNKVINEILNEPEHPHQHERLHAERKLFSARINHNFRIIYEVIDDKIYFLEIGPHKIYQEF